MEQRVDGGQIAEPHKAVVVDTRANGNRPNGVRRIGAERGDYCASAFCGCRGHLGATAFVALAHDRDRLAEVVRAVEELLVLGADHLVRQHGALDEVEQPLPEAGADEDDREVEHLVRLHQRQRLEELVERPEAAREEHEALGRLHEHDLARVEVVEGVALPDVWVQLLLVRKADVEADRDAAGLLRATVRGLHRARPAARHDREARLGEQPTDRPRRLVDRVALADARGSEDGDAGPSDGGDGAKAGAELLRDRLDRRLDLGIPLEQAAIFHPVSRHEGG